MSTRAVKIDNKPIIVITIIPPPVVPDDVLSVAKYVTEFKREVKTHVYRILDFSVFGDDFTFTDLVQGMAAERGLEGGINDMEVSSIYVGSSQWVVFGADAFQKQSQYGQTNVVHIAATVDEAIEYARAEVEKNKP
jgi:hypothetical protein